MMTPFEGAVRGSLEGSHGGRVHVRDDVANHRALHHYAGLNCVPGLDDVLVPLYWQSATLPVTRLVRLTRAVREAAQRTLERG